MSSDANPSREFYERALAQVPAVICDHEPTCSHSCVECLEDERDRLRKKLGEAEAAALSEKQP